MVTASHLIRAPEVLAAARTLPLGRTFHHTTASADSWRGIVDGGVQIERSLTRGTRAGGEVQGFFTAPQASRAYGEFDVEVLIEARAPLRHSIFRRAEILDALVDKRFGAGTAAQLPDGELFRLRRSAALAEGHDALVGVMSDGHIVDVVALDASKVRIVVPDGGVPEPVRVATEPATPGLGPGLIAAGLGAVGALTGAAALVLDDR